jgi:Ca2+-binding EF-hand superfamily protein
MNELTDEKQKEVKEAFELYDRDKDNLLNYEELEDVLKCLGYNMDKSHIFKILRDHGVTKNNQENLNEKFISFQELVIFLNKRNQEFDMEEELMETFRNFDKDGDGKLNHKEIKYLLLTLGEQMNDEEIEEFIKIIDTTGQGIIYYEDFVKLLMYK